MVLPVVFDLSPHGVAEVFRFVAKLRVKGSFLLGYFLQKVGYFLHFSSFGAFFRGGVVKRCEI